MTQNPLERYSGLMTACLIGAVAFLVVFGVKALYPENIGWLYGGDPSTHYLGWKFFRQSPWQFPIGLNPHLGIEFSNSIVYTDSIPLFAIPFKAISDWLPEHFQYFGFWFLLCFILQALFSYLIVRRFTENATTPIICTLFFVFAPPLITRMNGHLALSGHFLVIAALYLAVSRRTTLPWVILLSVASLVNAYLFTMCGVIWAAHVLNELLFHRRKSVVATLATSVAPVLAAATFCIWQAGYFSVSKGVKFADFGRHKMNVLAILDPDRLSMLIPDMKTGSAQYEGYSFLGIGMIVLLFYSIYIIARKDRNTIKMAISRHLTLFVAALILTAFALTHKVAFGVNEVTLFEIAPAMEATLGTFRSSGRMIWPAYYLLIATILYIVIKRHGKSKYLNAVLLSLATLSIWDFQKGWLINRSNIEQNSSNMWPSQFKSEKWRDIIAGKKSIRIIPLQLTPPHWIDIGYFASQNGLSTNAVYFARVDTNKFSQQAKEAEALLNSSSYRDDSVYILSDRAFEKAQRELKGSTVFFTEKLDGFHVISRKL